MQKRRKSIAAFLLILTLCMLLTACNATRKSDSNSSGNLTPSNTEETITPIPDSHSTEDTEKENSVKNESIEGTYLAEISNGVILPGHITCEVTNMESDQFTLSLTIYDRSNVYKFESVLCALSNNGNFQSDYTTIQNRAINFGGYYLISGNFSADSSELVITAFDEYSKDYDGTMSFYESSFMGYFNSEVYAVKIENSVPDVSDIQTLQNIGDGQYRATNSGSDYCKVSISDIDENHFKLDLSLTVSDKTLDLETATCYFDSDNRYVSSKDGFLGFYSDIVDIDPSSAGLNSENQDYWNNRCYMVRGYISSNGAVIYVTATEYFKDNGNLVENEDTLLIPGNSDWSTFLISPDGNLLYPAFRYTR